jgi:hypothetical protein
MKLEAKTVRHCRRLVQFDLNVLRQYGASQEVRRKGGAGTHWALVDRKV